jgi:hypothetical protein
MKLATKLAKAFWLSLNFHNNNINLVVTQSSFDVHDVCIINYEQGHNNNDIKLKCKSRKSCTTFKGNRNLQAKGIFHNWVQRKTFLSSKEQ